MTKRKSGKPIPATLANRIIASVAEAQHVSKSKMLSPDRSQPYFVARAIAAGIMHRFGASMPDIARHLNRSDHTVVINMLNRLEALIARDPDAAAIVIEMTSRIEEEYREHAAHMERINRITADLMQSHPSRSLKVASFMGIAWPQSEDAGQPWKEAAE